MSSAFSTPNPDFLFTTSSITTSAPTVIRPDDRQTAAKTTADPKNPTKKKDELKTFVVGPTGPPTRRQNHLSMQLLLDQSGTVTNTQLRRRG